MSQMDALRQRIREAAEAKEWSMNELSQRAGLHRNALQQLMSGRSKSPRLDTIRQIAFALGEDPRDWVRPMTKAEFEAVHEGR